MVLFSFDLVPGEATYNHSETHPSAADLHRKMAKSTASTGNNHTLPLRKQMIIVISQ